MRLVHVEIDTVHDAADKGGRQSERQKMSIGFLPVAIMAMTRWIAGPNGVTSRKTRVAHRRGPNCLFSRVFRRSKLAPLDAPSTHELGPPHTAGAPFGLDDLPHRRGRTATTFARRRQQER
jgi:hypothetical protein